MSERPINTTVGRAHTQLGDLAPTGFVHSRLNWATCWYCERPTHLMKPGAQNDVFWCAGTEEEPHDPVRFNRSISARPA